MSDRRAAERRRGERRSAMDRRLRHRRSGMDRRRVSRAIAFADRRTATRRMGDRRLSARRRMALAGTSPQSAPRTWSSASLPEPEKEIAPS